MENSVTIYSLSWYYKPIQRTSFRETQKGKLKKEEKTAIALSCMHNESGLELSSTKNYKILKKKKVVSMNSLLMS